MVEQKITGVRRIAGVNVPAKMQLRIGLQQVYGIGNHRALKICKRANLDSMAKVANLSESDLEKVRHELAQFNIEGDLRREVSQNIKNMRDSGSYRGLRHRRGLPVNGQRTKTNARTRKGKRKPIKK